MTYAALDAHHLALAYGKLRQKLIQTKRVPWIAEDMACLTNPKKYIANPKDAWQKLRIRNPSRKTKEALMGLAEWRERRAQQENLPRGWILKDQSLLEIAQRQPKTLEDLREVRSLTTNHALSLKRQGLLTHMKAMRENPPPVSTQDTPHNQSHASNATTALLSVLLKKCAEEHGVAPPLIATKEQLCQIAHTNEPLKKALPFLAGWRWDVFGQQAQDLKEGKLCLSLQDSCVTIRPSPCP